MRTPSMHILALAGGVGGAKLALGLSRTLAAGELTVVVNTGDDEEFHGLHVSPDLDTVMYTLAGLANTDTGWGVNGDSFSALSMLGRLGGETWFGLGDGDLGTHLRRTELLAAGYSLSEVTDELCRRLGVEHSIVPMSDQAVRTTVETADGDLSFQEYFVGRLCEPVLTGVRFQGLERATAAPAFVAALQQAGCIIICPSNPIVSIGPILALSGVRDQVAAFAGPRVVVSPIIGGEAVKGPAAKMLAELGEDVTALAVARRYQGLCDLFVLDKVDAALVPEVAALGMQAMVTQTLMVNEEDKVRLAQEILETMAGLR